MAQIIGADRSRFKRYWEQQAIQCAAHLRWAEAEKINRSIVKLCPEDVDAYNRLGKALWEMGQLQEAKESYRHALLLDPANAIAGRNLERLESSLETVHSSSGVEDIPHVPADIFIAESGKTTIVRVLPLPGRPRNVLPLPGDPLRLQPNGSIVRVLTRSGHPVGQLSAALSQRLCYLMESGNCFAAAVVGIQSSDIFIVIKEIYQHPSLAGQHSFPSQSHTHTGRLAFVRHSAAASGGEAPDAFGDSADWADLESADIDQEDLMAMEEEF